MKLLELRPDRALLKPNFDGYKLSLEPIPVLRTELTEPSRPDHVRPGEQQYSCLHAQLFGLQNHLVRDPWAAGSSYFVDQSWIVRRVQYDEASGRLKPVSSVFKIGRNRGARRDGDYNCSLVFLSEKFALIADGQGGLLLVETGDRQRGDEWKGKFSFPDVDGLDGGFVLADGRFEIISGERQIHAICVCVQHKEPAFEIVIHWLKAVQVEPSQEWKYHSQRVLSGKGFPSYCALEPKGGSLVLVSDNPFKFILDTENPIEPEIVTAEVNGESDTNNETFPFDWTQTMDDITIKIPKEEGVNYKITNDDGKLKIFRNEELVIDGECFFALVDSELTSWTNESSELVVSLFKQQSGVMWPFLFPGSAEETRDGAVDEMPPVSNLASQLEDCDFGITGQDAEYTIERLSLASHETTHKVFLGSNAPLFTVCLRPGFPAALALRHDVDACLWLQQAGTDWSLRHEGTLHAFGYVQASKQQRKFLTCSPDLDYAVICEAERHVFIYKASYGTASGLRNRNGPQVTIGQQQLVALEGSGEILGICCENDYTVLLTEKQILVLQLRIEE
ncbi:nudC domain-containing protein 1 [Topomyia yanbarensis]|uniref:nudC domain-containing protein 1 n=1 Tax=Topomyia yanbarensis TaxID=2498891 RepID=UPI00273A7DBE|nr:nudC domain-containing protein 1 [Topomyia yanbarensis]